MRGALVISLSTDSVPCEFAGRLAVDAGCAVVKLESPGGDPLRTRRGPLADWLLAGKRSVLMGPDGLQGDALAALLDDCSAVLVDENGRDWLAKNASCFQGKLVLVGERDSAALQGMSAEHSDEFLSFHGSGLGFVTPRVMPGYPSHEPLCPNANLLEFLTGLYAAISLFALLIASPRSEARSATVGLCGAALPLLRREIAALLLEGVDPHRAERIWQVSPAEVHRCRDGWLFVDVIEDVQWVRLCKWMGMPELGLDPRYTTREGRFADADAICAILDRYFANKPQACWLDAQRQGVPVAPVNGFNDLIVDQQLEARGFWGTIHDCHDRSLRVPVSPLARLFGPLDSQQRVVPVGHDTAVIAGRHSANFSQEGG